MSSDGTRLQVVNAVGLESYVEGVVGEEMPNYWPQAALEAQAVAARTYALAQLSSVVTASPFDLYDDTRSQVYGGIAAETPSTEQAVARDRAPRRSLPRQRSRRPTSRRARAARPSRPPRRSARRSRISSRSPTPTTRSRRTTTGARCSSSARAAGKALGLDGPVARPRDDAGPVGPRRRR